MFLTVDGDLSGVVREEEVRSGGGEGLPVPDLDPVVSGQ
jgi:hypothetical protein